MTLKVKSLITIPNRARQLGFTYDLVHKNAEALCASCEPLKAYTIYSEAKFRPNAAIFPSKMLDYRICEFFIQLAEETYPNQGFVPFYVDGVLMGYERTV